MGFGSRIAIGVAAGGAWNLFSFFCLANLLRAWLGPKPSMKRAIGWLLIKFPCLYAAAVLLFVRREISLIAFGVGFTVVLASAAAFLLLQASRCMLRPVHGR
jgi:hypothetical protein